ncbi:MAG: ArsR family transcriptional regulator [Sphingomonadaceae bacterium]|nr:ArsR family transcriptional regulator [Sphingomonadaceae bacterium]
MTPDAIPPQWHDMPTFFSLLVSAIGAETMAGRYQSIIDSMESAGDRARVIMACNEEKRLAADAAVLAVVAQGPMSRGEILYRMGTSSATVSFRVRSLLKRGLVIERKNKDYINMIEISDRGADFLRRSSAQA